jgi:[NiFe] hydrogenase diaphorase moiety small subunit
MTTDSIRFSVDGVAISARLGQSIIQACDDAGIYIPRLCWRADLPPGGECRLCTCKVNGRYAAACVTPAAQAISVENDTAELREERKTLIEMLFAEGNHMCPACEKSGTCDLQATAYRLGIPAIQLPYQWPQRDIDATHPQILLDRNTCILCGLCVRASTFADGKSVFGFEQRGARMRLVVNSPDGLGGTNIAVTDKAVSVCPVSCITVKHTGYETPYGERHFDQDPIGSDIESKRQPDTERKSDRA